MTKTKLNSTIDDAERTIQLLLLDLRMARTSSSRLAASRKLCVVSDSLTGCAGLLNKTTADMLLSLENEVDDLDTTKN